MAIVLAESKYIRYELSEEEILQGSILSPQQEMVIQNQISDLADRIINLRFDPLNPVQFGLEQADAQGQIIALSYLLDSSRNAKQTLLKASQSQGN